ncbi:MAG: multicopper oxidase domain-containing protein [Nitrospirae bacterium]|nr:multicopper oxidase domain-containing protein [Nitrospirota bacterium]
MNNEINRRDFLKYGIGGVATIVVGSKIPGFLTSEAHAAVQTLNVTITDAMKGMVTDNAINPAKCYFWVYKMTADGIDIPADCPGPNIIATLGDTVSLSITNGLDEPHAFHVPGMFDSGPINPGQTVTRSFTANLSGAHLYYDNLNSPVNRVMGLHGALIVMPKSPKSGHKFTPYDNPTPHVQAIYDAFGSTAHWPGLAWEEGDPLTNTPPFRQYVWLTHQASPNLFEEVGGLPAGVIYDPQQFMNAFLRDPFSPDPNTNRIPQFFTINGQCGHFCHNNCYITPSGRVGEPVVVHILNAGLWTHSMHLHANHMYVTSVNDVVQTNPIWVDVFTVHPMDKVDYTIPFMRPPDLPNVRGIGRPDTPLTSLNGRPVWPPTEEFDVFMPAPGQDLGRDLNGNIIDLTQRQSPLCYPMHDHSEPSQTAQGGNYNCGLISGIYFVGDRNTAGWMDFPMEEDFRMMYGTGIDRGCQHTDWSARPSRHE